VTAAAALALSLSESVEDAIATGTDHELALALAAWMKDGVMRHASAAGQPVASRTADAVANNLGFVLAQMFRRAG
jgi:hypothetical protein